MSSERTVPIATRAITVDRLAVEVLEGPDAGARAESGEEALGIGSASDNGLVLTDPTVSRYHGELARLADGVRVVDLGARNGIFLGAARVERAVVAPGTALRFGRSVLRVLDGEARSVPLHPGDSLRALLGKSSAMRRLMARAAQVAKSEAPVLLLGESGSGKEAVARAIHAASARSAGPFVVVDCGSIVPALVASELFGHEKGAFTGADRQHVGAFERAAGGTLFLDELGELPTSLQAALLGALERKQVRRVGGRADIATNVRVLAATHRDLREEVNRGGFRLDLYYRLAVVSITVPPLRERREDVPLLIEHFLREAGAEVETSQLLAPAVLESLEKQRWPGNVRELRNLVEATVALGELPGDDAPATVAPAAPSAAEPRWMGDAAEFPKYREARARVLEAFEREYLAGLMTKAGAHISRAAAVAGLDRSYLGVMLRRHGLRSDE